MNDEAKRGLCQYVIGTLVSAGLTVLAFWAVMGAGLERTAALIIIGIAAVAQIAVQLQCFLHVGRKQKQEDLQLTLFSLLLLALMVGGTIWIMTSLQARMH